MRQVLKSKMFGMLFVGIFLLGAPPLVHAAESDASMGGDEDTDFGGDDDDTVVDDSCESLAKSVGEEINRLQPGMAGNYFEVSQLIQDLVSLLTKRCPGWEPIYPKPIPVPIFKPDWARPFDGDYLKNPLPVAPIPPQIQILHPELCSGEYINVPADLSLTPGQIGALQAAVSVGLISLATYEHISTGSGGRVTASVASLLISLGILPAGTCGGENSRPYAPDRDFI